MKIALDEHIAPTVADAIIALLEDGRHGSIEVVRAKDYVEAPASSDTPWLRKFAKDGGSIVITGDKRMRTRPHEAEALSELGLITFFAPTSWNHMPFMIRASYLLLWWESIIESAKDAKRGTCWQLPDNWNAGSAKIKKVRLKEVRKTK